MPGEALVTNHPIGMTDLPETTGTLRGVSGLSERALERIDALFVQSAMGSSSGEGTVTLHGLTDSTVYFADRPRREVGHISSQRFIALWDAGENSFSVDPPNAVLSFLDEGEDDPEDAVVVLREPHLEGHELTYAVEVLEGELPQRSGPCALFIDAFGRSFSPVSVTAIQHEARPASSRPS
jgi:hypothetical protein